MLNEYLEKSTLRGSVKELMTPGLAAEFIQPWYTPLACTPATTGLPVGGIGSAFTVTPAGTTPALHFIPGVQVRGQSLNSIRLANFFYRESTLSERTKLRISNFAEFQRKDHFFPLVDKKEAPLFANIQDSSGALRRIQSAIQDPEFFERNRERLQRWGIEWSDRTQDLIDQNQTSSPVFNKLWLIDFFDGVLGYEANAQGSLTADWFESEISGQKAFPSAEMYYSALYPASATEYRKAGKARIRRIHWSPVLPGEERFSSLPVGFTVFEIQNPTKAPLEVTLVQSLENLVGSGLIKDRPGIQDASFVLQPMAKNPTASAFEMELGHGRKGRGVLLGQQEPWGDLRGNIAAAVSWKAEDGVTVSVKPKFYTTLETMVVDGALVSGRVNDTFWKNVYSGREVLATALCATAVVAPGATVEITFGLCLDFPEISLPGILSSKKYVAYFSKEQGRAQEILQYALTREPELRNRIDAEYGKILSAKALKTLFPKGGPEEQRFRTMAINTLAFLAEATLWDESDRFLVRECADYPFFNSLDVYFYGSFGLLALMPKLDGAVMRRFSEAVLAANPQVRRHHEYVNLP
ncbi:MAG TPA: GH116 family glycosyl-hydrolase, partial [Fibrobacteraceae bacterium]|nr:GH116 family glycosyl-hydrolase [Fibrobacteraceae bacterium]